MSEMLDGIIENVNDILKRLAFLEKLEHGGGKCLVGTLAQRNALTLSTGDAGTLFLVAEANKWAFWVWTGSAWQGPGTQNNPTGNAIGEGSVDLHRTDDTSTCVASGVGATIAGGSENTASGNSSFVGGGYGNTATGDTAMALGGGCTSSGYASMAYGYGNIADDDFSTATGTESHAFLKAERAHAAGSFAQEGDTQRREFHIFIETTNSTPTQMDIAADVLALGNYTTWAFEILIAARRTDANDESAGYKLEGVIDRQNGAASTALVGSVTKTVLAEDTGAWDVTAQADTTGGALQVLVTGENAKTIRWTGVVRVAHVSN